MVDSATHLQKLRSSVIRNAEQEGFDKTFTFTMALTETMFGIGFEVVVCAASTASTPSHGTARRTSLRAPTFKQRTIPIQFSLWAS